MNQVKELTLTICELSGCSEPESDPSGCAVQGFPPSYLRETMPSLHSPSSGPPWAPLILGQAIRQQELCT